MRPLLRKFEHLDYEGDINGSSGDRATENTYLLKVSSSISHMTLSSQTLAENSVAIQMN